jgi:glutamate synthase (NADPH/NADH) small chain
VRFIGENNGVTGAEVEEVTWIRSNGKYIMEPHSDSKRIIETDLVILALGFVHPVIEGLVNELGLELDAAKNISINDNYQTSLEKVFAAGDAVSGASLVVNAIASGRRAARKIDRCLRG